MTMSSKDILKRKKTLWALLQKPNFVTTGLYSTDKQALDMELVDLQNMCNHTWDETQESAIVDNVCEVCGKIFHD